MRVRGAEQTMTIVIAGEQFEQNTIGCEQAPIALARETMKSLARHYADQHR